MSYIQEAREIAENNQGRCISEICPTTKNKIILICKLGHQWSMTFGNLKYKKQWCKKCFSQSQKNALIDAQKLALSKNGKCMSTKYINNHSKLQWACKNNHIFHASFNKVSQGRWCPYCSKKVKHTIEIAQNIALQKLGLCLSSEYKNLKTNLLWQCKKGHIWEATLNNIKNHKRWCPECKTSKSQKLLLDIIQNIFSYDIYNNYRGFDWLGYGKQKQEIDIYIKLAIEYDGEQHFYPVRFGGISQDKAEKAFNKMLKLDSLKNEKIYQHPNDIKYFIRFNYMDKINIQQVKTKLIKYGVPI